jgi:hypothetical protein
MWSLSQFGKYKQQRELKDKKTVKRSVFASLNGKRCFIIA